MKSGVDWSIELLIGNIYRIANTDNSIKGYRDSASQEVHCACAVTRGYAKLIKCDGPNTPEAAAVI